jgi:micrococcal nuclease
MMEERKLAIIDDGVYIYKGKVLKVVDGDTVDVEVDLGFGVKITQRFRLYSINAPEMRGDQRERGQAARQFLIDLIADEDIMVKTYKDKQGKYGRYLADLFTIDMDCINDIMIKNGHAVEYMKK